MHFKYRICTDNKSIIINVCSISLMVLSIVPGLQIGHNCTTRVVVLLFYLFVALTQRGSRSVHLIQKRSLNSCPSVYSSGALSCVSVVRTCIADTAENDISPTESQTQRNRGTLQVSKDKLGDSLHDARER